MEKAEAAVHEIPSRPTVMEMLKSTIMAQSTSLMALFQKGSGANIEQVLALPPQKKLAGIMDIFHGWKYRCHFSTINSLVWNPGTCDASGRGVWRCTMNCSELNLGTLVSHQ